MDDPEIHAGYEFEEGMFARVRCWVDLLPWARLTRVPRILASPTYVGCVVLAWAITSLTFRWCFESTLTGPLLELRALWSVGPQFWAAAAVVLRGGWGPATCYLLFLVALWTPVVQVVARGGAGLTAGSGLPGFTRSFGMMRPRLLKSYAVPLIPWLCAAALAIVVFAIRLPGWLPWEPLSWLVGTGVGLLSIPLGVLCFGALFAIPLGLAAMVCEPQPDPIDAVSRGYESLFRRPLSFVWYLLFGGLLWIIARMLLGGVCLAAQSAAYAILSIGGIDEVQWRAANGMIVALFCGWQLTLVFGLLGGTYLLLRYDTGGQEIEDLWHPPASTPLDLPELPEQAYRS